MRRTSCDKLRLCKVEGLVEGGTIRLGRGRGMLGKVAVEDGRKRPSIGFWLMKMAFGCQAIERTKSGSSVERWLEGNENQD